MTINKSTTAKKAPAKKVAASPLDAIAARPVVAVDFTNVESFGDAGVGFKYADVVTAAREQVAAGRKASGNLALLVYRLTYVDKTLGNGKGQTTAKDFAAEIGYSGGAMTLLKRLGLAQVRHGFAYGSETYNLIQQNDGAVLGALVESDKKVSATAVKKAVTEQRRASLAKKEAKKGPDAISAKDSGDGEGPKGSAKKATDATDAAKVKAAFAVIRSTFSTCSDADLRMILNSTANLRTDVEKAIANRKQESEKVTAKQA